MRARACLCAPYTPLTHRLLHAHYRCCRPRRLQPAGSLESFLPCVGSVVARCFALSEDAGLQAALSQCGRASAAEALFALMLPAATMQPLLNFLFAAHAHCAASGAAGEAAALAAFQAVQDVAQTAASMQALQQLEQRVHWAGAPAARLQLCDAFRSLVREGSAALVSGATGTFSTAAAISCASSSPDATLLPFGLIRSRTTLAASTSDTLRNPEASVTAFFSTLSRSCSVNSRSG